VLSSFSASTNYKSPLSVVTNGLTLYLDGSKKASYSGSGSTWTDLTGSDNNATLVNSPTFSTNNGGYFTLASASSQYMTVSGTPLNPSSYTKSLWFYLNSSTDNNLLSYDDGSATGHYMFLAGTNRIYCGHTSWTGFPSTFQTTGTISNSTWYNVAVTFNTTDGMKVYINGSLDSTYTAQKTAPATGAIRIGSYSAGGNLLNGRIGKVLCYNRSITASEVLQNYNVTRSLY
jgi:hypothetical protein